MCLIVLNTGAHAHTHTHTRPSCSRGHACFRVHGAPLLSSILGPDKRQPVRRRSGATRRAGTRDVRRLRAEGPESSQHPGSPSAHSPEFARKLKLGTRSSSSSRRTDGRTEERSGSPGQKRSGEPEPSWRSESAGTLPQPEDGAPDCYRRCRGRWERIRTAASSSPSSTSTLLLLPSHVTDEASYLPTVNVTSTSGCSSSSLKLK